MTVHKVGVAWIALVMLSTLLLPLSAHASQTETPQKQKEVWFRVRINSRTLDWFNQVARPSDVASLHSRDIATLAQIRAGQKQVLFASAAEAERVVPEISDQITSIAYDLEHWPQTPMDEQLDPVGAVKRLRALVDRYGLELALGPDRRFTAQYGVQMAPYADEYILQVQRLQSSHEGLLAFTKPLIEDLRAANPDLKITIQLRPEGTVQDMLAVVAALYDEVDAVSVLTNASQMGVAREFVSELQSGESAIKAAAAAPRPTSTGITLAGTPQAPGSAPRRTDPALTAGPIPTRAPQPRATRLAEVRATRLAWLSPTPTLDVTSTPIVSVPEFLADAASTATPEAPTGEPTQGPARDQTGSTSSVIAAAALLIAVLAGAATAVVRHRRRPGTK